MLRSAILTAAASKNVRRFVESFPPTASIVQRFVAGVSDEDAVSVVRDLARTGLFVTLEHLGEDTRDPVTAEAAKETYCSLLSTLAQEGLTETAEVSLKLSALGSLFDTSRAISYAAEICDVAQHANTTVTFDTESAETVEDTLSALEQVRKDFPHTGAVVQAYLRRTEGDCKALAYAGSRVRLCKGAYAANAEVAFQRKHDVDLSFVRCLNILLAGEGYPMVATHDPRLIAITSERMEHYGRAIDSVEFQMLYGVRTQAAHDLSARGYHMRLFVPYGQAWYEYLMRRLAERPANVAFFLRALVRG